MELINWAFNAVDQIISTRHTGRDEPRCPGGTFTAGYVMDPWNKWRVMCLSVLSVEDIEDVYLLVTLVIGVLGIAVGIGIVYWRIGKMTAIIQKEVTNKVGGVIQDLMLEKVGRMMKEVNDQMHACLDKICVTMAAQMMENTGRLERELKNEMQNNQELSHRIMESGVDKITKKLKELEDKVDAE